MLPTKVTFVAPGEATTFRMPVCFNKEINKAKRTIPGKAYIYQAMGKPMILGENPANHELYSEKDPGITFVEMGSGRKLAEKILESAEK